jgi:hypothetical protein
VYPGAGAHPKIPANNHNGRQHLQTATNRSEAVNWQSVDTLPEDGANPTWRNHWRCRRPACSQIRWLVAVPMKLTHSATMARMDEKPTDDWRDVLRREHEGDESSFTWKLRAECKWDHVAYERVFFALRDCCKAHEGQESVERWIAEVFYYLSWYPKQEVVEWGKIEVPYYQNGVCNFDHLAWWMFMGLSRRDDEFEPINDPPPPKS